MTKLSTCVALCSLGLALAAPAGASVIYNNLTPTNAMAVATRPDTAAFEIEAGDDFTVGTRTSVTSGSFIGLFVPGSAGAPTVSQLVVEIYRVFPLDSNVGRTSGSPLFSTPQVPTRVNSPSDVAFDSRDSAGAGLTFSTVTLNPSLAVLNSVQAGGIHAFPNQTSGGNGPVVGQEVQINFTLTTPFDLPADHYFFVPQVLLGNGGQFLWLSASRPISGAGTTPIAPDLQAWTRDAFLDPDWLRIGTDIVGGQTPPTFNTAFSLEGNAIPEPSTVALLASALALFASRAERRRLARALPR